MNTNDVETGSNLGSNTQGNSPSLATVLSSLSWGGAGYPNYEGRLEDAGGGGGAAAGAGGGGSADGSGSDAGASAGSGAGAGAGSPSAGQGGSGSSSDNGAGNEGAGAGAGGNADNIRTLRTNYEALKPWEAAAKAGIKPQDAVTAHQRVTTLFNDGLNMARALGYTDDSFKAAFEDDPVDTLATLRAEHAKANPGAANAQQLAKLAEDAARRATQPVTEAMNRQATEAAMSRYEGELNRLLIDDKIGFGKDVSQEVRDAITDIMFQSISDDVLLEIKNTGKLSGIQPVFEQAKATLIKIVNAYNSMMNSRGGNGGNGAGAGNSSRQFSRGSAGGNGNGNGNAGVDRPITLDDIINSPETHLPGVRANKY